MNMVRPKRCFLGTLICLFSLLFLLFVVIFVVIPVVFKFNVGIQRAIIFPTWIAEQANYSDVESFGISGVKNFYINVNEKDNVTLGVWHILPRALLYNVTKPNDDFYDTLLRSPHSDILLFFHGNGAVRSLQLPMYEILRQKFQILAIDYRGYADSTNAQLNEDNIVDDMVHFYNWVKDRAQARIFIWGHSLGTAISTHTISNLKSENLIPAGLVLETPFTTIPDVMEYNVFIKLISWLPWYKTLTLEPVVENGFEFNSIRYILDVDCPIMILHAKDDSVVPYQVATKLYETALSSRNYTYQGNVTYHLFEAVGYDHMRIYLAPELPDYVWKFVDECIAFENRRAEKNITYAIN